MRSSITIANYFLRRGWAEGIDLTQLSLLKLVYIAHGWHLGAVEKPLISDRIEAWHYGPIIPTLYHRIKHYGKGPITDLVSSAFRGVNQQMLSEEVLHFLDPIWHHYKKFTAFQLSAITHQQGTPWAAVRIKYPNKDGRKPAIMNEAIRSYYRDKIVATHMGGAENS